MQVRPLLAAPRLWGKVLRAPKTRGHPSPPTPSRDTQRAPKIPPKMPFPARPLQERHLRTLWKEPPAVTKAQRPVQTVMM